MIKETKGDLFLHSADRVPVHCIAADHKMGAGIAVPMAEKFNLRDAFTGMLEYPACIYRNGVMNLVTKKYSSCRIAQRLGVPAYMAKPTYESLTFALEKCADECRRQNITHLVMPRIGCGLDGLDWNKVKPIIEKTLGHLDVLVCSL